MPKFKCDTATLFYRRSYHLPPVDTNQCDVTAILAELQYLQSEVHNVTHLAEETAQIQQLKSIVDDICQEVGKLKVDQMNFPPLPLMVANGQLIADVTNNGSTVVPIKFSDQVHEHCETGIHRQQPRKTCSAVIGL